MPYRSEPSQAAGATRLSLAVVLAVPAVRNGGENVMSGSADAASRGCRANSTQQPVHTSTGEARCWLQPRARKRGWPHRRCQQPGLLRAVAVPVETARPLAGADARSAPAFARPAYAAAPAGFAHAPFPAPGFLSTKAGCLASTMPWPRDRASSCQSPSHQLTNYRRRKRWTSGRGTSTSPGRRGSGSVS
jgi:hypothetical protein